MQNVTIYGRLTRDLTLRKTGKGKSVTNLTVAVDRNFSKGKSEFIDCVAWDQTADNAEKYLGKGCRVIIIGEYINTDKVTLNGTKYKTLVLNADRIVYIDFKKDTPVIDNGFATDDANVGLSEDAVGFGSGTEDEPVLEITSDDLPF